MLPVSSHLLVLHMAWYIFQDNLFHDLTEHRGEADWPVAPRVLLFILLENGHCVSLFLLYGDFAWLPWLLKYDGEWLGNNIHHFPQEPVVHLIMSHGLVYCSGFSGDLKPNLHWPAVNTNPEFSFTGLAANFSPNLLPSLVSMENEMPVPFKLSAE